MHISVNPERKLFILDHGQFVTCHGFEVVARELGALLSRFGQLAFLKAKAVATTLGSLGQYEVYQECLAYLASHRIQSDTWFNPNTPRKVCDLLEDYRISGKRLRVFYGDASTGRDWMCESDMLGRIGRSTGTLRIPLLVPKKEHGGPGLLDDAIVRLIDVASKRELYRHPTYHQPSITLHPANLKGYTHEVSFEGVVQARFKSAKRANEYIAFLTGASMKETA